MDDNNSYDKEKTDDLLADTCFDCGSKDFLYSLKIISSGREFPYPKYLPQIKQVCADCDKFKRFARQDVALINKFNQKLKEIQI